MSKKDYKSKITEDAVKRFRMLCEYTFNITEDDGEQEPDMSDEEMPEDSMGNEGNQVNMAQNQEMPQDGNMEQPMDNMGQPMDNMGGQEGGPTGFNPSNNGENEEIDNTIGDDIDSDTETMQSDDEVIDVDELTQSQEKTEEKVDDIEVSMEKGFHKLLDVINKLDKMIDNSTSNMEEIKKEIEKRNPTPLEKLNMRAANDSYPFNIKPNEYWKEKELNSNYRIGGEDEPDAKQYTITQNDIDGITDFNKISKELNNSEFNQNLMNIFGLR